MCFCCVLVLFRMLKTWCQLCSTEAPLRPSIAEFINGALDRCLAMFHFFSMAIWRGECWSNGWSTLWLCQQFAIENGHRNSGVIFHSYVNVYQRVMVISLGCKKPLIWEKEATGSIKPSDTGQTCSDPKRQRQQFQKPTLISQFSILEAVGLLWGRLSLKKEVVNTINSLVIYEYHWNIIKDLWS
jgi:hypothetical protein